MKYINYSQPPLKLDQHFLRDENILNMIIEAAELKPKDIVLEIGAGKGALTSLLAKKTRKVIAIEADESLKPFLDNLSLPNNVEVHYVNALEIIYSFQFNKIVSNIPYAISEPLLKKLFKLDFELAVLLIGSNFYNILLAKDSKSKWSIITPLFFDINKITDVTRASFRPAPRTDSVLIVLKRRTKQLTLPEQLIQELALQDDKKLRNALITGFARIDKLTQKQAKEKVAALMIDKKLLDKRVEHLSNRQFEIVSSRICEFLKIS